MRERSFLKALCCSIGSFASLAVLAVIVAQDPAVATVVPPAEPAVSETLPLPVTAPEILQEEAHEAPRAAPRRRSASVVAAAPQLLPAVDQPDIRPGHRLLADRVLRSLPSGCSGQLQNFYVRYDNPTQRGLGGKSTIILDGTVPDAEFAALLIHECGHLAHGALLGNPASGLSAYRDGQQPFYNDSPFAQFASVSWETERVHRRGTVDADFASGYGKTDAFEDFAEFYAAYILQRPSLVERAKTNAAIAAKLSWMDAYFPTPLHGVIESRYTWDKKVPWDVTKLPYVWAVTDIAKAA